METNIEYTASLKAADLATIAKVAKCVHKYVSLALSDDGISFWAKDERKECAIVGGLPIAKAVGELRIRASAEQVADVAASLPKQKADAALRVISDGEMLMLKLEQAGVFRTADVAEAQEDDQPFQPDYKAKAGCVVDLTAFSKVLMSFKRSADVMTVKIVHGAFEASYKTRDGSDAWTTAADTKGEAEARFSVALLLAAVKAAKAVGMLGRLQISKAGPMRIRVQNAGGMKCDAYVVSSQPI